jgi:putative transposase
MVGAALAGNQEKAKREGRVIVFADETAFHMTPTVAKTWSPVSRTPVLSGPVRREHLSVIGGLTLEGRLYIQVHESSVRGYHAAKFVRHLLMHISGRILLMWDSARIHKSKELVELRQLDTIGRLKIEHFPPYAPEVDPQEYVWRQLKHVYLQNLTSHSIDELWDHLDAATRRLRARVGLLKRLTLHAGLK